MLTPDDLVIPDNCDLFLAADTGTFMSGVLAAIDRSYNAFVLAEVPNYRYVSDRIELNDLTIPEWAVQVAAVTTALGGKLQAWADPNTQFRGELRHYGIRLIPNTRGPDVRVRIAREYFKNHRIRLAPWLRILPWELENAKWPDEATVGGKYTRVRKHDHTLVCLEHILSRRPRASLPQEQKKETFLERYLREQKIIPRVAVDPHLGAG
jgi:hypothetical protein